MLEHNEKVYYVWRTRLEGTTDCYSVSFSEDDPEFKPGSIADVVGCILNDIKSMPVSKSQTVKFAVKTIPGPDMIFRPVRCSVTPDGEYFGHSFVCRLPLSREEMVELFRFSVQAGAWGIPQAR